MVRSKELDKMIAWAGKGPSLWDHPEMDVSQVARKARIDHAAEVLLELGYDQLAGDLLRLEREGDRIRIAAPTVQSIPGAA